MESIKNFLSAKWLTILAVVLAVAAFLFVLKRQSDISNKQAEIEKSIVEQKQLAENIVRSQASYATKQDIENYAKSLNLNLDVIRKDLEKLNGRVVGINNFLASSAGYHGNDLPSDGTIPRDNTGGSNNPGTGSSGNTGSNPGSNTCASCDKFGYLNNTQILKIEETFPNTKVPVGEARFSAWKEKPWGLTILPRDYSVTTVIGTDEEGRHYTYNKFTIKADGKEYPIQIKSSKFVEQYPEPKFYYWNPRLYMGVDGGFNMGSGHAAVMPGLHVGIMSYGKSKVTPEWSFLQFGMGYDFVSDKPNVIVSPAVYNIGRKFSPLTQNTYIGPSISADTSGNFTVSVGLRVGL